jgi:PPOX class probable F420-dependent enzyme
MLQLDVPTALTFLRENPRAILATTRADGHPQLSPIVASVDADGQIAISSRETAVKVKNLRRDPFASLCVINDGFYGGWVQLEGPATVISLPDAMDSLIEYYRSLSGEHPDWDEYRAAMVRQGKSLLRITITRWGPIATGGFPPEVLDKL